MKEEDKKIYLYGDNIGRVELVEYMGNDKKIVNSARVSFGKDNDLPLDDKDIKLIKYLVEHQHTSVFEHNVMTFKFVVPLFVRSQHHRHRTWSYNEISRRYSAENLSFYEPKEFRTQAKNNRQASNEEEMINPILIHGGESQFVASVVLREHHQRCVSLFNEMLENGICREQARGVLPQNLYTEYYGTVNLNNLMKFIKLRDHEGAQYEIKVVARALREIASKLYPETFKAFGI